MLFVLILKCLYFMIFLFVPSSKFKSQINLNIFSLLLYPITGKGLSYLKSLLDEKNERISNLKDRIDYSNKLKNELNNRKSTRNIILLPI